MNSPLISLGYFDVIHGHSVYGASCTFKNVGVAGQKHIF